jgi:hypothetical protein
MGMQMTKADVERLIRRCYEAFNDRDLERALALMHGSRGAVCLCLRRCPSQTSATDPNVVR